MEDAHRQPGAGHVDDAAPELSGKADAAPPENAPEDFDESLFEEVSALIDDGRTYAEAELAFQKTRAKLAGRLMGVSALLVVVALILLHIAFLALAVGLVIALEPLVTIWGAIAIVVGGLLALVCLLGWMALRRGQKLGELFGTSEKDGAA